MQERQIGGWVYRKNEEGEPSDDKTPKEGQEGNPPSGEGDKGGGEGNPPASNGTEGEPSLADLFKAVTSIGDGLKTVVSKVEEIDKKVNAPAPKPTPAPEKKEPPKTPEAKGDENPPSNPPQGEKKDDEMGDQNDEIKNLKDLVTNLSKKVEDQETALTQKAKDELRTKLIAEAGADLLLPELVKGDTEEEIKTSIENAKARSKQLAEQLGTGAGTPSPTPAAGVPSAVRPEAGGNQTLTLESVGKMDQAEYAKNRDAILKQLPQTFQYGE